MPIQNLPAGTYANLSPDLSRVESVRNMPIAFDAETERWLPLITNAPPGYNVKDEVLVPEFVIGASSVTRSWIVVSKREDVFSSTAEAARAIIGSNTIPMGGFTVNASSGSAAPTVIGGTLTTAVTMSYQVTASATNKWFGMPKKRFQTSTTAGNVSGMRTAYGQWYRGSQLGYGGFLFQAQLGMQINLNGGHKFIGLCASTAALAGEPSALLNCCGMGYDSTDASTGNWFFIRNNGTGSGVKVDLGLNAARNVTDGFELNMFSPAGGTKLLVSIKNIRTGAVVLEDIYLVKIPVEDTLLAFKAEVRNGAVAAADNIEVGNVYIKSNAEK